MLVYIILAFATASFFRVIEMPSEDYIPFSVFWPLTLILTISFVIAVAIYHPHKKV